MQEALIGCAGWSIPGQHRALFGEGSSVLARYATRFPAVEINTSFYRSHRQSTYARWADSVPPHFRFSVKMPKAISHEMALRGSGHALDQFLGEVSGLGGKLGGFLLQLPPRGALDLRVASTFFRMFRRRSNAPLACEPRHTSWFSAEADALFQRHAIARVTADPPILATADGRALARPWPYMRLHGTPRIYYSDYPEEALQAIALGVAPYIAAPSAPWIIFDNTAQGFAIANAARLQDILRVAPPLPRGRTSRTRSSQFTPG